MTTTWDYLVNFSFRPPFSRRDAEKWLATDDWVTDLRGGCSRVVPIFPSLRGGWVVAAQPVGVVPWASDGSQRVILGAALVSVEAERQSTASHYLASRYWLAPLPAEIALASCVPWDEQMFASEDSLSV